MPAPPPRLKLLFLCTGNSCRSQMAEGWAHTLRSDSIEPFSAGIVKHGLNPRAVRVMQEVGVDITGQQSKTVEELGDLQFDLVITVCGHADEHCPAFAGAPRVVHVGFDDPPKLAIDAASEDEALDHFRRVRDEIRDFVKGLPGNLPG
ncbi:MAG: arsenate reductase ArsC [Planctomycetota bacterium]|nr:arsenate reductase ArsC [Planctomycetota bacterium]